MRIPLDLRLPQIPDGPIDRAFMLRLYETLYLRQREFAVALNETFYADTGIQFPSTQVDASDVNTLDDYEEGTWTPADGSGAGLTLTVTSARYTKVGRLVVAQMHVVYPVTVNGANAKISGLPFSALGTNASSAIHSNSGANPEVGQITGTAIDIFALGGVAITNAQLSGNFVILTASYHV